MSYSLRLRMIDLPFGLRFNVNFISDTHATRSYLILGIADHHIEPVVV